MMALNERLDLPSASWSATETSIVPDRPHEPAIGAISPGALPISARAAALPAMLAPAVLNRAAVVSAASGQSLNYQIQYNDPYGYAGSMSSVIEADMNAAMQNFVGEIHGAGTLVVQLNIVASNASNAGELADGGPSALMPNGSLDGRTLETPASLYELRTGTHVPGYGSDIVVNVPSSALGELYFDPNPAAGDNIASVAPAKYDAITVFRHEVTHGLGFISLRDTSTGTLGSIETAFDHYSSITSSGADYFTGANAEAVYGGAIPITTLQNGEQYSHLGNNPNGPLASDLMSGTGLYNGVTHQVSSLDFAILRDIGVPETGALPCFAAGTRIATTAGDVPVEQLRADDLVLLAGGGEAPITWIGSRRIDIACHPDPQRVAPILITAGAIAEAVPVRDLYLSPDHALFFEGTLIPAKALLNGVTVRQVHFNTVTYFHVELADHAVILAEGTAAETYLDTGNRSIFLAAGPDAPHHDAAAMGQIIRERGGCAPFAEAGPVVSAVRGGILHRAGIATTDNPELSMSIGDTKLLAGLIVPGLVEVALPADRGDLVIATRRFMPAEATADPRDRRLLGISVSALELDRGGGWHPVRLDDPALAEGWHSAETTHRWTNGHGVIPAQILAGATRLRLRFQSATQYRQAA
jgi:hypothetical protein